MEAGEAIRRFGDLVEGPEAAVPLDEAALCIAACAHPGLDVARYLARLDALAASCPAPTLDRLVVHLFQHEGFHGNGDDYYDPDNSLLDRVLDRRTGIPITLSVLAMEVGRRLGVPLAGVGLPGHFLLRDKVDQTVFVDAFHGGALLDERGCQALHRRLAGPQAAWDDTFLDPVGRYAILTRMLGNLQSIYEAKRDREALSWVLRLRLRLPGAHPALSSHLARLGRAVQLTAAAPRPGRMSA